MDYLRTDAMLMEVLQERKTIVGFLDALFGFLRRNTDFYHNKRDVNDKIGFEKGMREQLVFGTMQHYDPNLKRHHLASDGNTDNEEMYTPPAVSEIEVETEDVLIEQKKDLLQKRATANQNASAAAHSNEYFTPADYKNGQRFENYCWSQTLRDVELHVKLPTELRNAKDIYVEIKPEQIAVRNRKYLNEAIISGQLSNRYKHNDAIWSIIEGKLLISLDKNKEVWWEKFFNNEQTIDLKKLDCERYVDELSEDTQAAIQKLRAQQLEQDNAKQQKIVAANDKGTVERLRLAWDAEGSPFKGQPFDPSVIDFS